MTDEQIIELMARAIFSAEGKTHLDDERMFQPVKWEELDDDDYQCVRGGYRSQTRAALTALRSAGMAVVPREPTEAMYAAACDPQAVFRHTKPDERGGKIPLLPAVHYRAMINTAEGKPSDG